MRPGLEEEVCDAFAGAIEMCGCMPDVDLREAEQKRLSKLCDEVLQLLRQDASRRTVRKATKR